MAIGLILAAPLIGAGLAPLVYFFGQAFVNFDIPAWSIFLFCSSAAYLVYLLSAYGQLEKNWKVFLYYPIAFGNIMLAGLTSSLPVTEYDSMVIERIDNLASMVIIMIIGVIPSCICIMMTFKCVEEAKQKDKEYPE